MRIEVHWHPTAVEQLAAIWLSAAPDDKDLLRAGFDYYDSRLRDRTSSTGVPLAGSPLFDYVRQNATGRIRPVDWPILRMIVREGAVVVFSAAEEARRVNVWFVCRRRVDISGIEPDENS